MQEDETPPTKELTQVEKARKGWWFSIIFFFIVLGLILFLAFVPLQADNRDIIVGIIGTITGTIGSMLSIAAGRDPSEVEELKDKLATANADRQALIARLRDSQIQMQILREQIFELQTAVIEKLSIFQGSQSPIKTKDESQIRLHKDVEAWLPQNKKNKN